MTSGVVIDGVAGAWSLCSHIHDNSSSLRGMTFLSCIVIASSLLHHWLQSISCWCALQSKLHC